MLGCPVLHNVFAVEGKWEGFCNGNVCMNERVKGKLMSFKDKKAKSLM